MNTFFPYLLIAVNKITLQKYNNPMTYTNISGEIYRFWVRFRPEYLMMKIYYSVLILSTGLVRTALIRLSSLKSCLVLRPRTA